MTFYHWDPNTTHYLDNLNRIVIFDGASRGAPDPYLRQGEVVCQSKRVQKMLELCDNFQEEATGAPGNYAYNDAGTRFLNRDPHETCIKTLLECNKRAISELERVYNDLEEEKDGWSEKISVKYKAHFATQARQEAEHRDWVDGRNARDPAHVKFFWQ